MAALPLELSKALLLMAGTWWHPAAARALKSLPLLLPCGILAALPLELSKAFLCWWLVGSCCSLSTLSNFGVRKRSLAALPSLLLAWHPVRAYVHGVTTFQINCRRILILELMNKVLECMMQIERRIDGRCTHQVHQCGTRPYYYYAL